MRKLTKTTARKMAAKRKSRAGGRPAPKMPCGWCGKPQSAAQMRKHFTQCAQRPQA